MVGTDTSLLNKFCRSTGAGHRLNREFDHVWKRAIVLGKDFQNGVTKTTFGPVILNSDNFATSFLAAKIRVSASIGLTE